MTQYQENAVVRRVEQLSAENFRIELEVAHIPEGARPGQFVMLRNTRSSDPLLRRPFCIHQVGEGSLQIYFKVVGRGTKDFSQLSAGEEISVLGPLGNGFTVEPERPAYLVGGGLGIAPLLLLAAELVETTAPENIVVILGGRTAEEVQPLVADFAQYGVRVEAATDDGSFGSKGFVTALLAAEGIAPGSIVYTCGPEMMMSAVYDICREQGVACEVSVEKEMACGMGACLGCCKTKADGSYTHVCINGPVYKAEELQWKK